MGKTYISIFEAIVHTYDISHNNSLDITCYRRFNTIFELIEMEMFWSEKISLRINGMYINFDDFVTITNETK